MKMFEITNLTKRNLPSSRLRFQKIKEMVLGIRYELSLVFISPQKSKKLNKEFRGKDKIANVLSFPLEKNCGEIFINLNVEKETSKRDLSYKKYVEFLLIHGCLHLKGLGHGDKMSKEEKRFLKKI